MANKSNNEHIDGDALRAKKGILRAHDVMPPYKKIDAEDKTHKQTEDKKAKAVEAQQGKGEIPRFDLAEEIMAEQRKISAIRRKAPGERIEAQKAEEFGPVGYTIGRPIPVQPYEEQIIADIVARDIEMLCRGDYSSAGE